MTELVSQRPCGPLIPSLPRVHWETVTTVAAVNDLRSDSGDERTSRDYRAPLLAQLANSLPRDRPDDTVRFNAHCQLGNDRRRLERLVERSAETSEDEPL